MFSSVSVAVEHGCALRTDGTIACWESPAHTDGRAAAPDGEFLVVSAGADHSCAVSADHAVECWGENKHGQVDGAPGF
jgi:alpha-tubulin suppressor-like RCC1 family protein